MPLNDAQVAVKAAEHGAAIVLALSGQNLEHIGKGHNDFSTQADIDSEKAILDIIREEKPHDAVVGEESGAHQPTAAGSGKHRIWLVDPLCGTLNYAVHTHDVAVNVALQDDDGHDVAAAVADPFMAEVFWTDGVSAFIRRDGIDRPLTPPQSPTTSLVEINFHGSVGKAMRLATVPAFRERFSVRVLSTTLPVPWVAAGRRAAYVTDGDLKDSVHYAAAISVCKAAGCIVTGIEGQPLHTGVGGLLVTADRETHLTLVSMLGKV